MRRGGVGAIAASPTMVGAVTTLIVILAVFLAYNANNGLPFVPSYRISVQVPNAETLVPGNDVRIGGVRVGFVEDVVPVQHQDGRVHGEGRPEARQERRPDSRWARPSSSAPSRRSASSTWRSTEPTTPTAIRRAPRCRSRRPTRIRSSTTRCWACSTPRPGPRSGRTWSSSAPCSRAGARRSTRRIGQLRPLLRRLEPVARNLASQQDRAWPASSVRPATGRGGRPGRGDAGADVRRPRHHLRRPRVGRAAVHPGHDHRDAADVRHAHQHVAANQHLPASQRGAVRRPASGRPRARARTRRRSRRRSRPAPASCRVRQRSTPSSRRRPSRWSSSHTNPNVQGGISRADAAREHPHADAPVRRAGPVGLQLRDSAVPQRAEHLQHRRRHRRPGSGSS